MWYIKIKKNGYLRYDHWSWTDMSLHKYTLVYEVVSGYFLMVVG